MAAMEAAENDGMGEEEGDFDLDDNFLELAGGVDEPQKRVIYEQFRATNKGDGSDSDEDYDGEDDFGLEDQLEEVHLETNSILKKKDQSNYDKRFSEFYDAMNNNEEDYEEEEEEFPQGDEDGHLEDFAEDFNGQKDKALYEVSVYSVIVSFLGNFFGKHMT